MSGWRPIATAPRGLLQEWTPAKGPAERVLLYAPGGFAVGYWDIYYTEGGRGFDGSGCAWVEASSGELVHTLLGAPTHWQPLPLPPTDEPPQEGG